MHVKTNIEHNIIQVVALAICPLFWVLTDLKQALFFVVTTAICFVLSALVCSIFNKFLSRNVKIFITAILSTFIVTLINEYLKSHPIWGIGANDNCFFAVLSTICLCVDIYFIQTRAVVDNYFVKVISDCLIFSVMILLYVFVIEFLSKGSLFGIKLVAINNSFFGSITFKFIWLGVLAAFADLIFRVYVRHCDKKKIIYQKFIKQIRDEKEFQYNELRRKRLLASPVEVQRIGEEKMDDINQKSAENAEIVEKTEKPEEAAPVAKTKMKPKKRPKKSKGSKVEKVYQPKKDKNGGEDK